MSTSSEKCTAIFYKRGSLGILDQLLLPEESRVLPIATTQDAWKAIQTMQVRGAPAIAIVGILSVAIELNRFASMNKKEIHENISNWLDYLVTSRPTAVNMRNAAQQFKVLSSRLLEDPAVDGQAHKVRIIEAAEKMFEKDVQTNRHIGKHGAEFILRGLKPSDKVTVLTVCNTGSLATAGYGTALGVIRSLHEAGRLEEVICTETRPYNQGERLTAYELMTEKMPATMICDNMVSFLMKRKNINAVIVGADRVAANGDTANKIGTYQAAIVAKYHEVPFYVACPSTTVDPTMRSGDEIPIEERPGREITTRTDIPCWNPAFDITSHTLITGGIITECGVFAPGSSEWKRFIDGCRCQRTENENGEC
ncbi:methylthioribose-1-phosphate isomerase-like [Varroa jacobsoni]|uniref:methylthioribose-1-phosphate isomerase-like n=1 Tax=Varroa jacobsoni TaxID=62625 RepID=UPI000BF4C533|nr:methylthioribose-1-phosphate isomerase-like [Varroa jacobsoni]XP_022700197.1 methylthioribose-1-phosphate isomerase-like [Varroa jacobsoni]